MTDYNVTRAGDSWTRVALDAGYGTKDSKGHIAGASALKEFLDANPQLNLSTKADDAGKKNHVGHIELGKHYTIYKKGEQKPDAVASASTGGAAQPTVKGDTPPAGPPGDPAPPSGAGAPGGATPASTTNAGSAPQSEPEAPITPAAGETSTTPPKFIEIPVDLTDDVKTIGDVMNAYLTENGVDPTSMAGQHLKLQALSLNEKHTPGDELGKAGETVTVRFPPILPGHKTPTAPENNS